MLILLSIYSASWYLHSVGCCKRIILGPLQRHMLPKNPPFLSVMDGVGMGLGFTIALLVLGIFRELLGAGTVFGVTVTPSIYNPIGIFVNAPGAFLVLAFVVAAMNAYGIKTRANKVVEGCDGCCASCSKTCADEKKEGEA